MLDTELLVVPIDKRCTKGAEYDAKGYGDEHETSEAGAPSFPLLIDDGVSEQQGGY